MQNTSHDTRSWSVFGEFTIDLGERLQLSAGLRHIDEKKSMCSRYRLPSTGGLELRRAPGAGADLQRQRRLPLGPGEASLRLNYAFKSDYHTLLTNNAFSKIESYVLLDTSLNYAWGERYLASVFARNLTDEDYFTHAFAVPLNEALWNFATPREPRIWGVEFRATF